MCGPYEKDLERELHKQTILSAVFALMAFAGWAGFVLVLLGK